MLVTPYERIVVDKFGSQANFCRLTGFKVSTVSAWLNYSAMPGVIPQRHWRQILAAAEKHGIPLTQIDFLETYEAPKRKRGVA